MSRGVFAEAETQLNPNDKLKYGVRVDKVQAKADKANVVLAGRTANSKEDDYIFLTYLMQVGE